MPSDKPWEDESLKGEYYKEKKRLKLKPLELGSPKPPKATDAWAKAGQFTRRNQKIEEATRPLRKALPGQGS